MEKEKLTCKHRGNSFFLADDGSVLVRTLKAVVKTSARWRLFAYQRGGFREWGTPLVGGIFFLLAPRKVVATFSTGKIITIW